MNLTDPIRALAATAPGIPALVQGARTLDRAGLDAAVGAAAGRILASGLVPGTVAAVVPGADRMLHAVVVLALARAGIVQLPIRATEPAGAAADLICAFGATALIAERPLPGTDVPPLRPDPAWLDGGSGPPSPLADATELPWIVASSSGTTGRPKAIAVTHAMEAARNRRDQQGFVHPPGEPFMTLIEPGFYNSTSAMVRCLWQGGAVVLDHGFQTFTDLVRTVRERGVRFLQMTPGHLFALVEALPDGPPALPDLRVLRISSAALPPRVLDLARRRLADCVHLTYGTNEAGTLTVATPDILADEPASVGRTLDGIAVEIVDGEDRAVAPGRAGFVRVRGAGVMVAYLGDDTATARHCRGGWFYPGDVAVRTAGGLLFLKGRSDRTMNIGGVLTAAEEIEALVLAHPAVAEAAVVPIESERFQVMPAIAVVLRHPVALAELSAHLRASPRSFPFIVTVVAALPRTPIGKIDYPATQCLVSETRKAQAAPSAGNSGRSRT